MNITVKQCRDLNPETDVYLADDVKKLISDYNTRIKELWDKIQWYSQAIKVLNRKLYR